MSAMWLQIVAYAVSNIVTALLIFHLSNKTKKIDEMEENIKTLTASVAYLEGRMNGKKLTT